MTRESVPVTAPLTIGDVEAARARIAGAVHRTPLLSSRTLGQQLGLTTPVYLKAENFQKTGAFKVRGALNTLKTLSAAEKERGVITVSAGNHAQGVAWAAAQAGVRATVVMATIASPTKTAATRAYGAEVILHGDDNIAAFAEMERLRDERNLTLIHPYDALTTIAGQGTVGLEMLEDLPADFGLDDGAGRDTVVVAIGGGGLISGVSFTLKSLRPGIRVIGVEPYGAPTMHAALEAGQIVRLQQIQTAADGLTAPFAGELTLAIVQQFVDQVILIDETAIAAGLHFLMERTKLVVEMAGAAPVGALLSGAIPLEPGARVAVVIGGGNIDRDRLKAQL